MKLWMGLSTTLVGLSLASWAAADTLFLRTGKTLKVDALSCHASTCRVTLPGGEVEVAASEVVRVEPDEEVDFESAPVATTLSGPAPTGAPRVPRSIEDIVAEAAHLHGLPRSLVRAVARAESAFRTDAVSSKGAQGVMQLMPGTAKELGVQNPFDPVQNIHAGARLLRQLLEKYEGRVAEALAAYNAGPGAVARHQGVPPYAETRSYIRKVVKDFQKAEAPTAGRPEPRR